MFRSMNTPDWLRGGVTLVIWDSTRNGSFQPTSCTSTIPKWWHSLACHSYFGNAGYMKLSPLEATGGSFPDGHAESDDMEGQPKWDPQALETLRQ